jgi:AcrR family transcriptional regulator
VRQIASAARVSPGLVIHHFGSKDGLAEAVDGHVLAMFDAMLGQLTSEDLYEPGSAGSMAEAVVQHRPKDSPVPAYLRRLLLAGGDSGRELFRRLYQGSRAALDAMAQAGLLTMYSAGLLAEAPQDTEGGMMTQAVLEAREVTKAYRRHEVLRGVNLTVAPGQLAAVGLNDNLTVGQHLRYFAAARRIGSLARADELVSRLGYEQYLGQLAGELSGGTRQKVNLTLALIHDPDVLLLDEPYQGFDWETYLRFWDLVSDLRAHVTRPATTSRGCCSSHSSAYGALGLLLGVLVRNDLEGFFLIIMGSLMDTFLQNPLGNPLANKPVLEWFPSFGPTQFAVAGAFGHTAPWDYLALGLAWPAAFAAIGLVIFRIRTRTRS